VPAAEITRIKKMTPAAGARAKRKIIDKPLENFQIKLKKSQVLLRF
jgi:hypothetical protein